MVAANPLKPKYNAGELSPRLAARTDLDRYQNGVEVMENMVPLTEGGVMRRAGTRYVAEVKDSTDVAALERFEFSTSQAYILEIGEQYMRFFRNQGQIAAGATDAAVTNGSFSSDITSWDNSTTGGGTASWSSSDGSLALTLTSSSDAIKTEQSITISSSFAANEHVIKFRIAGRADDKVSFAIGATSSQTNLYSATDKYVGYHVVPFTPNSTKFVPQWTYQGNWRVIDLPSTGSWTVEANLDDVAIPTNSILELQTPWGSSQVFDLAGPQSADVRYMLHNQTPPHRLERYGHTEWSLVEVLFTDGPYFDTNLTDTTLTANSTDGRNVTVTASTTTNINDGAGFGSSDIGRAIRMSNVSTATDNWGWGVIVGSTSTTAVTVDVKRDFPTTSATKEWKLGAWSDETGWPGVGTFHQQRLVLARSVDEPQTLWFSQTGDFENMAPDSPSSSEWEGTVEDDDALDFTISADQVETVEWLAAGKSLQIGTRSGEWQMTSAGAVVTPTDVTLERHTQHGSARIQPVRVGQATLFVQRAKRRIRELAFNFETDGLVASDMMRLAPHIGLGGIVDMAYAQEPDSIVWSVRADGELLSMTYRREEEVVAHARHIVGGSYGSAAARVKSVATIPGSTASGQTADSLDRDEVWVIAERTINGSTKKYVEFIESDFEDGDSQVDAYYLDSMLTYDSTGATVLTGFSHIAAETAGVLANGAVHPDVTVSSSGAITLDYESSTVQVGLKYTHRLKTMKLDYGGTAGTAVGATKTVAGAHVVLLNSQTLSIGVSSSDLDVMDFREVGDAMDTAPPLFTGETHVQFEGDWETDPRIVIESDDPTPFTLLALVPELKTNDIR